MENLTDLSFLSVWNMLQYITQHKLPVRDLTRLWKYNMQLLLKLHETILWNIDKRTHSF
jgi:hypothetical protein